MSNINTTTGITQIIGAQAGAGSATGNVPVVVASSTTAAGTTGTGAAEAVVTLTVPANTLSADGQVLLVLATWTHAANTNSGTANLRVFGTNVNGTTSTTSGDLLGVKYYITRLSSTSVDVFGENSTASGSPASRLVNITGIDLTTDLTIVQQINNATSTTDLKTQSFKIIWLG